VVATTIRPRRSLSSIRESERQKTAITSEATVMSNPLSRVTPLAGPPRPITTLRRARSFMSTTRFQVMRPGSMPRALPLFRWLSMQAESRLWATPMAWKSPVKWRLISSMGTTWA